MRNERHGRAHNEKTRRPARTLKVFTRNVYVLDIDNTCSAFRNVTLGGEAVRGVEWTPDRIHIQGGWVQRTYTPMDWDAKNGRTRTWFARSARHSVSETKAGSPARIDRQVPTAD